MPVIFFPRLLLFVTFKSTTCPEGLCNMSNAAGRLLNSGAGLHHDVRAALHGIQGSGRYTRYDHSCTGRSYLRGLDRPAESHVSKSQLTCCNQLNNFDSDVHGQEPDETIHVDLASDIVKALYNEDLLSKQFWQWLLYFS